MNLDKINRTVTLLCPTCGGSDMESIGGHHQQSELLKCNNCGLQLSRDELMNSNQENINANLDEMKQEAVKEAKSEIEKMLRDAFKGNKNITFK